MAVCCPSDCLLATWHKPVPRHSVSWEVGVWTVGDLLLDSEACVGPSPRLFPVPPCRVEMGSVRPGSGTGSAAEQKRVCSGHSQVLPCLGCSQTLPGLFKYRLTHGKKKNEKKLSVPTYGTSPWLFPGKAPAPFLGPPVRAQGRQPQGLVQGATRDQSASAVRDEPAGPGKQAPSSSHPETGHRHREISGPETA